MDDASGYAGRLRKRRRATDGADEVVKQLLELVASCDKVIIFSGSGLSANSGMSMFSTRNGLYERARQRFKIQDGIKLFSYPFYKQRRMDVQSFFAQIYGEAQNSRASPGHVAIAQLHELHKLQRHYTLNIDGLAEAVGMDTWHHERNPEGITVEMHGNISYVVCPSCHSVEPLSGAVMSTMKACQPVRCKACKEDEMRFKVMLYDDEEGDCITPEDVFERLEEDLQVATAVIWVGISFEQSASTEYFRKVRYLLSSMGRLEDVTQVIINPSDEAYFNVVSSMSKKEDVRVLDVRGTSDDVLPRMVLHIHKTLGMKPDPAYSKAAAEAAEAAAAARRLAQQLQAEVDAEEAAAAATAPRRSRGSGGGVKEQSPLVIDMNSAAAAALDLPPAALKYLQQQLGSAAAAADQEQQQQQQQVLEDPKPVLQEKAEQAEQLGVQEAETAVLNGTSSSDGLIDSKLQQPHQPQQPGSFPAAAAAALHSNGKAAVAAQHPPASLGAVAAAGVLQAALQALQQQQQQASIGMTAAAAQPSTLWSSPALVAALAAAAAGTSPSSIVSPGSNAAAAAAAAANSTQANGIQASSPDPVAAVASAVAAAVAAARGVAAERQAAAAAAHANGHAGLSAAEGRSLAAAVPAVPQPTSSSDVQAPPQQQHLTQLGVANGTTPSADTLHAAGGLHPVGAAVRVGTPPASDALQAPSAAFKRDKTPPAADLQQHAAAAAALQAVAAAVRGRTPPTEVQQAAAAALQAVAAASGALGRVEASSTLQQHHTAVEVEVEPVCGVSLSVGCTAVRAAEAVAVGSQGSTPPVAAGRVAGAADAVKAETCRSTSPPPVLGQQHQQLLPGHVNGSV